MPDPKIERTPTEARQAVPGGRVFLVLSTSMALAMLAMFAVLGYFYAAHTQLHY